MFLHTDNLVCDFSCGLLFMSCMLITLFVFVASILYVSIVGTVIVYLFIYLYAQVVIIFVAFLAALTSGDR